jgi:hypothetical protein
VGSFRKSESPEVAAPDIHRAIPGLGNTCVRGGFVSTFSPECAPLGAGEHHVPSATSNLFLGGFVFCATYESAEKSVVQRSARSFTAARTRGIEARRREVKSRSQFSEADFVFTRVNSVGHPAQGSHNIVIAISAVPPMRGTTGQSRESLLADFVTWSAAHVTGDEKGEAQIFLDRLFRAFGQKGSLDVGGTAEMRIRKASEDGGGTSLADYVWKPVVLIEMKKRGADLSKHYRQAFDYWVWLVPGRPQYVVLCNFDEFSRLFPRTTAHRIWCGSRVSVVFRANERDG